jgi:DNA-binding NtrC family response regulator
MRILVVDDEKLARMNIVSQFDENYVVTQASNFEDARNKIRNDFFDICYIDLKLENSKNLLGLELIPEAVKKRIYTVVMTSIEDEDVAELAYEKGCQDVYNKGHEKNHISETLNRYFLSKDEFTEGHLFKDLIQTQSKKYKEELKRLLKIIPTEIPICILGESGTGKSYLAKTIHTLSRRKGNFVEINCATLSGDTLKSELFGHAKGSFTGATGDNTGKLSHAHNGTLFLDEIGSMTQEMQEMLLKAIEERAYYPLGSNKLVKSDFRVICATLDDLEALIRERKFRFDLFQRINGFTFKQPALRDRKEDIIPLLKSKLSSSRKVIIKEDAKKILESYKWPGNIRELFRFSEVISLSDSGLIKADHVQEFTGNTDFNSKEDILLDHQYRMIQKIGLREFLELISRQAVKRSLQENNEAVRAISELGISSSTFYKYYDRGPSKETANTLKKGQDYEYAH